MAYVLATGFQSSRSIAGWRACAPPGWGSCGGCARVCGRRRFAARRGGLCVCERARGDGGGHSGQRLFRAAGRNPAARGRGRAVGGARATRVARAPPAARPRPAARAPRRFLRERRRGAGRACRAGPAEALAGAFEWSGFGGGERAAAGARERERGLSSLMWGARAGWGCTDARACGCASKARAAWGCGL